MAVVVFDYAAWVTRYPEFAGSVNSGLATEYFNEACLFVDNTDSSPIPYNPPAETQRATILNMTTAHIAMMNAPVNGQPASPLVGRIETATEGSVSVTAKYADQTPEGMAWWVQTKYGAAAYRALGPWRRGFYIAGPPPRLNGLYWPAPVGVRWPI